MAPSAPFSHAPDPEHDPIGELLSIDFELLEVKLLEFCTTTMRNPRSKELEDLIEACRKEE